MVTAIARLGRDDLFLLNWIVFRFSIGMAGGKAISR
jgi:hypothetical protein